MKKLFVTMLMLIVILGVYSCVPKDVYISGNDEIELGSSALYKLENYDKDDIIWSISNSDIATIINGMVVAEKIGDVKVIAKIKNKTFEKDIKVVAPTIQLSITGKNYLYVDETYTYQCSLSQDVEERIVWTSSNQSILEIDEFGNAVAKQEGTVDITASVYHNKSIFNN